MNVQIRNIVLDCGDPRQLADFYCQLLGMRILREDWLVIGKDEHTLPRLAFEEVPGYRPPLWPDPDRAYPQQMHMCLDVDDPAAATELVERLGAHRLPDLGGSCPVYADPAGHPFCLCGANQ